MKLAHVISVVVLAFAATASAVTITQIQPYSGTPNYQ